LPRLDAPEAGAIAAADGNSSVFSLSVMEMGPPPSNTAGSRGVEAEVATPVKINNKACEPAQVVSERACTARCGEGPASLA